LRFRRAKEPRASKGPANKVEAWLKSWTTERAGVTTNAQLSSARRKISIAMSSIPAMAFAQPMSEFMRD